MFLQTNNEQYTSLGDGRKVCSECLETNVMSTQDCQPFYRDILKFYKNQGMSIEQEIPMLLVPRDALNNAREAERDVSSFSILTCSFCFLKWFEVTIAFQLYICALPCFEVYVFPSHMLDSNVVQLAVLYLLNRCATVLMLQEHIHAPETRGLCLSEEQTITTVR